MLAYMIADPPTASARHRFHLLDALRGIAAFLVMLVHVPAYAQQRFPPVNSFMAVDFFFCLSGFVIAHSYQQRLQDGITFRTFLRARLDRLYPVYLLCTLLGFVWALTVDRHTFGSSAFLFLFAAIALLPNLLPQLHPFLFPLDLPAWSLLFELLVNAAYAFLVRNRAQKRWLFLLILILSAAAVVHWLLLGRPLGDLGWTSHSTWFLYGLARTTLSFVAGVLCYRIFCSTRILVSSTSALLASVVISLAFVAILRAPLSEMRTAPFQLLCIILLFPALVLFGAFCRLPRPLHAACGLLGDISYPTYLLHVPLLRVLGFRRITLFALNHPQTILPMLLAAMSGVCLCAWFTLQWYERPVRRWLVKHRGPHMSV